MIVNKVQHVAKNVMFSPHCNTKTMSARTSMLFWVTSFIERIFHDELSNAQQWLADGTYNQWVMPEERQDLSWRGGPTDPVNAMMAGTAALITVSRVWLHPWWPTWAHHEASLYWCLARLLTCRAFCSEGVLRFPSNLRTEIHFYKNPIALLAKKGRWCYRFMGRFAQVRTALLPIEWTLQKTFKSLKNIIVCF